MKHTKQRRHRKAVTFYKACFGFRAPFKVLCDGTFVHNLVVNRVAPADTAIANILSGPVKLFTTRCVLEEIRRLGSSHDETLAAARSLSIARCDHEGRTKADSCILDVVKENNSEHFFVATQDADLRRKLQEMPGVPVMFGLRNALFLETPSAAQRKLAKRSEEKRLHITEKERQLLRKRTGVILASIEQTNTSGEGEEDLSDHDGEAAVARKIETVKKGLSVKDKPNFKRKKARRPNPLSCLKKKNGENRKLESGKEKEAGKGTERSRSRNRKRSRKSKPQAADN